jgi:hypothetical protein
MSDTGLRGAPRGKVRGSQVDYQTHYNEAKESPTSQFNNTIVCDVLSWLQVVLITSHRSPEVALEVYFLYWSLNPGHQAIFAELGLKKRRA